MEPLAALPETPVKFKSMQQLYIDNVDDSSTETDDDLDGMQERAVPDEWSDSSDSQEGDGDGTGKKVAFGKLVRRKEMSITQNRVFETSYVMKEQQQQTTTTATFKTLAQLIDPRSNERVKCCSSSRRKSCLAKKITARRNNYRLGPGPRPSSYGKRCKSLKQPQAGSSINLVVDLVFQRTRNEGHINLSSSGSTVVNVVTPEADGSSTKISSQGSVDQDRSASPDQEEECNAVTVRDPNPNCLSATRSVASAFLPSTVEQLKWREVDVGDADPSLLINRTCKVFGPLENRWYKGFVQEYDEKTKKFRVVFSGGNQKWQLLAKERLALYISLHDKFKLIFGDADRSNSCEKKALQENLLVLAASTEDLDDDFGHADIVWAEVTGYPFWPAFVMDEDHAKLYGPGMCLVPGTLPVQFFGSHECARVNCKRVVGFSKGLRRDYHLKCNRVLFDRGLEELDRYFVEGKLPQGMSYLQGEPLTPPLREDRNKQPEEANENDEDFVGDERKYKVRKSLESIFKCPIKLGSLRILSLGKIVKDSEYFHDQQYIWTEGYTATRRFFSTKDPSKMVLYKMEVLKNPSVRTMPLFRVTPEDGDQVEGPSAAACWKKIFDRLQRARGKLASSSSSPADKRRQYRSGASMFGLAHPRVSKLIQSLPYARVCSKFKGWTEETASEDVDGLLPAGFKHVGADSKHLDRCSVCYTNEEYEGNVLLQCDKCRMLVHLNCYGVLEAPGDSWLCNLCDANAPKSLPLCCLCPILGGAMKRTTDGRWVHLACALWIPETCCVDMDRMEPIDGIQSINKERWKLTCTICSVPYGACIQCADHHCRVAYHPLCARAAGFSTKVLEGLRRKRNRDTGIQEEERSVQLLSYCKKHMQSGRAASKPTREATWSSDEPPYSFHNISGCARSEAYNVAARRGRREPEHYSAALAKRAFLENRPYIVTGCLWRPYKQPLEDRRSLTAAKSVDYSQVALSTSERFNQMRSTLHQRLTFGKSAIHGWGLFAKQPHEAGDMVIEYAGEVIRPVVADDREKRCYNSLVGAGTYMFCIDNERVVDATRSGSIAHLINHSCEPNCYSRVVAAHGKERIIIFAKQDIAGGEEVTYDYRFTSIGEQLACHCGSAGCRGIVNVMDEEDESGRILVNASEITRWQQQ